MLLVINAERQEELEWFVGSEFNNSRVKLLITDGYTKEEMSIHGFRTIFSTLARENNCNPDHIEKQLAHKEPNAVVEAYDRSQYFEQRRVLMQAWADYLDELRDTKLHD